MFVLVFAVSSGLHSVMFSRAVEALIGGSPGNNNHPGFYNIADAQADGGHPQDVSGSEAPSHRLNQHSEAGNSAQASHQGGLLNSSPAGTGLLARLTGQSAQSPASQEQMQYERVSDDHSLPSHSESGSEGGSDSHNKSEAGARQRGGTASQAWRARKKNVLRATRSKSGANSWFRGKRGQAIAEGLKREPWPSKDVQFYTERFLGEMVTNLDADEMSACSHGTEVDGAREQSIAGKIFGTARSVAGSKQRAGSGGDDVVDGAGALNVVVIDRSKLESTAGMKL